MRLNLQYFSATYPTNGVQYTRISGTLPPVSEIIKDNLFTMTGSGSNAKLTLAQPVAMNIYDLFGAPFTTMAEAYTATIDGSNYLGTKEALVAKGATTTTKYTTQAVNAGNGMSLHSLWNAFIYCAVASPENNRIYLDSLTGNCSLMRVSIDPSKVFEAMHGEHYCIPDLRILIDKAKELIFDRKKWMQLSQMDWYYVNDLKDTEWLPWDSIQSMWNYRAYRSFAISVNCIDHCDQTATSEEEAIQYIQDNYKALAHLDELSPIVQRHCLSDTLFNCMMYLWNYVSFKFAVATPYRAPEGYDNDSYSVSSSSSTVYIPALVNSFKMNDGTGIATFMAYPKNEIPNLENSNHPYEPVEYHSADEFAENLYLPLFEDGVYGAELEGLAYDAYRTGVTYYSPESDGDGFPLLYTSYGGNVYDPHLFYGLDFRDPTSGNDHEYPVQFYRLGTDPFCRWENYDYNAHKDELVYFPPAKGSAGDPNFEATEIWYDNNTLEFGKHVNWSRTYADKVSTPVTPDEDPRFRFIVEQSDWGTFYLGSDFYLNALEPGTGTLRSTKIGCMQQFLIDASFTDFIDDQEHVTCEMDYRHKYNMAGVCFWATTPRWYGTTGSPE